jgi:hypothetical protein
MRSGKAAEAKADLEARIVQIEQMTLDQIATFQGADIATGRIAPREASALDRALSNCARAAEAVKNKDVPFAPAGLLRPKSVDRVGDEMGPLLVTAAVLGFILPIGAILCFGRRT